MRRMAVGLMVAVTLIVAARGLAEPVIIEGVPRLGWATGRYSYHIAALQAALSVVGRDVTYEYLMLASGAGFRTAWLPGRHDYAATCIYPPGEDYVLLAAAATGTPAERVSFRAPDEARRAICKSIDRGFPVIAWEESGAQVLCGYDLANDRLYTQSCNSTNADYQVVSFRLPASPPPFGTPREVVLFTGFLSADLPEPTWHAILSRAQSSAHHPADQTLYGGYVFGLAAYDAWAQTLQAGVREPGPAIAAAVTVTHANTLADARTAVAAALEQNAELHAAFPVAASHYRAEAATLKSIPGLLTPLDDALGWDERAKKMGERLSQPSVRGDIVRTIQQAKAEEINALEALHQALADFAPEIPEGATGVSEASEEAERHYEQGLSLKRAGRYAEAEEQLRAAIEADPDHVDAHWTLAWVLVELKDAEKAANEFRKVIELAPDSKEAQEAQKTLDRLGR